MIRKGFEAFADVIDTFVRDEMARNNEALFNNALIYGENERMYRGAPGIHGDIESSIKDPVDGVAYFMIDFDRVGRPAKTGA